jgi:fatty acid/phospholipid biosynthesis enzyme
MPDKLRVALDCMGGDFGASVILTGAERSLKRVPNLRSSWNRVGKVEGLRGHRARNFRDIWHFCRSQNVAQMLDGKTIETSSAALGYIFI